MASVTSGTAGRKASIDAEKYIGATREDITKRAADAAAISANQVKTGTKALTTDYGKALTDLQTYYPEQQGYLDQGIAGYDTIARNADAGTNLLSSSLGINGPEAGQAALAAFREANPGYDFQRSEAENSVLRKANQGGMLASGNMLTALSDRTQGLADSTYGSWQDRLAPYMAMSGHVADARAGLYGQKANAAGAMGTNTAAIHTGLGDKLLQAGEFGAGQTLDYNNALNQNLMDLGSQQVAAHTSGMMAGQQAAQNKVELMKFGVSTAADLAGKIFGGKGK